MIILKAVSLVDLKQQYNPVKIMVRISLQLILLLLVSVLFLRPPDIAFAGLREDISREFVKSVNEFMIPGAVLMVEDPNKNRWSVHAGEHLLGSGVPFNDKHRIRIGSITKTFVASVVLMLIAEGKVELDTPVHQILPELISSDDNVTIRHLLQMRSGLDNYSSDEEFLGIFHNKPWKKWTPVSLLAFSSIGEFPPGLFFRYCNSNYVLLGMVVEKVTGDSFENQVHKRILSPLKLKSTSFPRFSSEMKEPYARGYDFNPETGEVADLSLRINPSWAWCSGNAVSTASDILEWLVAYLDGFGINDELFREQFNFKPTLSYGVSYGLGVMNKYDAVGHNGNFAGIYTSFAFRYRGYYFVIFTNGQTYGGGRNSTAESVFWNIVQRTGLGLPVDNSTDLARR